MAEYGTLVKVPEAPSSVSELDLHQRRARLVPAFQRCREGLHAVADEQHGEKSCGVQRRFNPLQLNLCSVSDNGTRRLDKCKLQL